MNDYLDYNNEEVSNYEKKVDPREHNVANRIKELQDHKTPIIEDDTVTVNQMKSSHKDILSTSDNTDDEIKRDIEDIKRDLDDDSMILY